MAFTSSRQTAAPQSHSVGNGADAAARQPNQGPSARNRFAALIKRPRSFKHRSWGVSRWSALLLCLVLALSTTLAGLGYALTRPTVNGFELQIRPHSGAARVAQDAVKAGAPVPALLLRLGLQLRGLDRTMQPGIYLVPAGSSAWRIMEIVSSGKPSMSVIRFVEGWTFAQFRQALQEQPQITHTLAGLDDAALMAALGRPNVHPEGRFFPDTYYFASRAKDTDVLQLALTAMDKHLARAWENRDPSVPLRNPTEALILASIVEKETGLASDRAKIASVFTNRLRLGMRLQTDPTVIFGLGSSFDGNLTRAHLRSDTPYNSYTRNGLPPTPIAAPGAAALAAATRPAQTNYLYFVATGDDAGSSVFSSDLAAHNAAVRKFQMKQ